MKKVYILIVLVLIIFCCKNPEADLPDRITVTGVVKDTLGQFLSKVSVSLMEDEGSLFGSSYTKDIQITNTTGRFKFEFNQNKKYMYELRFSKTNHSLLYKSIDRNKEYQYFEVTLNSFIPRTFPGQP